MKVIDPGHIYALRCLDNPPTNPDQVVNLFFVKREGENYPGNVGHHYGTTTQEVLRALIDRTKYVNNQINHPRNYLVIHHLRESLFELELRAAERHNRVLPLFDMDNIENIPTCTKCGHIGCGGECHR